MTSRAARDLGVLVVIATSSALVLVAVIWMMVAAP